jgi:hypothetical protein
MGPTARVLECKYGGHSIDHGQQDCVSIKPVQSISTNGGAATRVSCQSAYPRLIECRREALFKLQEQRVAQTLLLFLIPRGGILQIASSGVLDEVARRIWVCHACNLAAISRNTESPSRARLCPSSSRSARRRASSIHADSISSGLSAIMLSSKASTIRRRCPFGNVSAAFNILAASVLMRQLYFHLRDVPRICG